MGRFKVVLREGKFKRPEYVNAKDTKEAIDKACIKRGVGYDAVVRVEPKSF